MKNVKTYYRGEGTSHYLAVTASIFFSLYFQPAKNCCVILLRPLIWTDIAPSLTLPQRTTGCMQTSVLSYAHVTISYGYFHLLLIKKKYEKRFQSEEKDR